MIFTSLGQLAIIICSSIASLGLLAGGLGYLVQAYKGGSKADKADVTNTAEQLTTFWKDQVQGFKDMVAVQNEKISSLTQQLGNVQGQLVEKDKKYNDVLAILQNRNPEMEAFMKTISGVAEQSQTFMANVGQFQSDQHAIMTEIKNFMGEINIHLKAVDQDLKIEATVTKK